MKSPAMKASAPRKKALLLEEIKHGLFESHVDF